MVAGLFFRAALYLAILLVLADRHPLQRQPFRYLVRVECFSGIFRECAVLHDKWENETLLMSKNNFFGSSLCSQSAMWSRLNSSTVRIRFWHLIQVSMPRVFAIANIMFFLSLFEAVPMGIPSCSVLTSFASMTFSHLK